MTKIEKVTAWTSLVCGFFLLLVSVQRMEGGIDRISLHLTGAAAIFFAFASHPALLLGKQKDTTNKVSIAAKIMLAAGIFIIAFSSGVHLFK